MRRRRTSRQGVSRRRVSANPPSFVQEISPLDYSPTGYPKGSVQRLALIDTDIADPERPEPYFQERRVQVSRSKTGRPLKKARTVVEPGASPGTVSFLDYAVWGKPGEYQAYINYMATRADQRGKGLARTVVDTFMQNAERSGVAHVNFGRIMNPAVWKLYMRYRDAYERGQSRMSVSGKKDF